MPIKVSGNDYIKYNFSSEKYEYYEENMKNLIVNGVEKYRLVVGGSNKLIWAKGKINFDLNFPKDGSGKSIESHYSNLLDEGVLPRSLYAFYDDGFYKKGGRFTWDNRSLYLNDNTWYRLDYANISLARLITDRFGSGFWTLDTIPATFEGWWTVKSNTGGIKVDKITDVPKTGLFDYKKSADLPEITLYARWKIKTFTITVRNITRKSKARSSFTYYDSDKKKWIKTSEKNSSCYFKGIPWGTPVKDIMDKNIKDVKYITWAKNALKDNEKENKIRAGVQRFLGWTSESKGYESGVKRGSDAFSLKGQKIYGNETWYPVFETLFIWKSGKNWQNKEVQEGYWHFNPAEAPGSSFYEYFLNKKGDKWTNTSYRPELKKYDSIETKYTAYESNKMNGYPIHSGTYIFRPNPPV